MIIPRLQGIFCFNWAWIPRALKKILEILIEDWFETTHGHCFIASLFDYIATVAKWAVCQEFQRCLHWLLKTWSNICDVMNFAHKDLEFFTILISVEVLSCWYSKHDIEQSSLYISFVNNIRKNIIMFIKVFRRRAVFLMYSIYIHMSYFYMDLGMVGWWDGGGRPCS